VCTITKKVVANLHKFNAKAINQQLCFDILGVVINANSLKFITYTAKLLLRFNMVHHEEKEKERKRERVVY